jgi:hypothetical protein
VKAKVVQLSHDEEGALNTNQVIHVCGPVVVHSRPIVPEVLAQLAVRQALKFRANPESDQTLHWVAIAHLAGLPSRKQRRQPIRAEFKIIGWIVPDSMQVDAFLSQEDDPNCARIRMEETRTSMRT